MTGKPEITNQEIVDSVFAHLYEQGERSMTRSATYGCAYRGRGGAKCAVGCLIPDENYYRSLEGLSVLNHLIQDALPFRVTKEQQNLLRVLQCMHDSTFNWHPKKGFCPRADWTGDIASSFNVTIPPAPEKAND